MRKVLGMEINVNKTRNDDLKENSLILYKNWRKEIEQIQTLTYYNRKSGLWDSEIGYQIWLAKYAF